MMRFRAAWLSCLLALPACGSADETSAPAIPTPRGQIPHDQLNAVIAAHYRGLGAMERYEYAAGIEAFREVHQRAPGWIPGMINLAIALLNEGGEAAQEADDPDRARAEGLPKTNMQQALRLLDEVLKEQKDHPAALYCKGIILEFEGQLAEAHAQFARVAEIDPGDPNVWLELGSTLTDPEDPTRLAGPPQAATLIEYYTKALERNPYLVPALFKLQTAYSWSGDREARAKVLALWDKLNPKRNAAAPGDLAAQVYGEMGKYARIINPFAVPEPPLASDPPPRFAAPEPIQITLDEGDRWSTAADFRGEKGKLGWARSRFGAGVATFDANGDGRLDLYLTAAIVGPKGLRDALLIRQPDDHFVDATRAMGLPEDRAGIGVAAADFDADRRVDLFLFGVGDNRLLRNAGTKFEDVTERAQIDRTSTVSVGARWLDLDQDGDLDLYVINHARMTNGEGVPPTTPLEGVPNVAYRNDGQAAPVEGRPQDNYAPLAAATPDLPATQGLSIAFSTAWPGASVLGGGDHPYTAIAALDIDEDRDIDLVLASDFQPLRVLYNDRIGTFHEGPLPGVKVDGRINGLLSADLDKDGRVDLFVTAAGRTTGWRNPPPGAPGSAPPEWTPLPIGAQGWFMAQAIDLDFDQWPDLVGCYSRSSGPGMGMGTGRSSAFPTWSRNLGHKFATGLLAFGPDAPDAPDPRTPAIRLRPDDGLPPIGFALADLAGDVLPDFLLIRDGAPPRISRNLGNGQHWLAIDLAGRWKTSFDQMRTNSQGIGTRLTLEGQGIHVPFDYATTAAGTSQSVGPIVLGLGPHTSVPLLRVRWPDGVMQSELNVTADKILSLNEVSRKTGSCPVLFTWNGTRFECLGDFLGGGGLGYLVAPGVYGQPDRDESVAIAPGQLAAVDGVYRLAVVEPMDEVAYLDRLRLDVVDSPPGAMVLLDERFAPEGPRPSGDLIVATRRIDPAHASDHKGRDQTGTIRAWDRRTVDGFRRRSGWVGYAEDHSLILDFGDRLSRLDPNDRVTLSLAGWVEYPYSQTNYAAATAGVTLRPPTLERRRKDGTWEMLDPSPGYPAGLPRRMSVDLTGKVAGPSCVLRLSTNMECYWDEAFVAVGRDGEPPVRTTTLPVARARLGDKGYLREVSPDGRLPLVYDYDHPDPAPLARMSGVLTRHGDVAGLLAEDDDQFCTVGPGDEVRLEFDGRGLPALGEGWTRQFVLKAVGYCKDADPFTAASDSVGPLPWERMPPFPFKEGEGRPTDPAYEAYLRTMQTRPAGSR
ncbi:FG-GAP-like repeat-containing protein [Tundrisphaera sp. TA3]|uniref:FG-GAP-like repeat-containing protein n=1 Tax=Tundrisphaera sp. TA3 TaxID=3435775 RepID=UPI003EB82347